MRRLMLLRHAKSAWPSGVPDRDRPLNERGRAAAPLMGRYLAEQGLRPDHVMVSSARRTLETWDALRESLPDATSETVASIYEAPARRILEAIRTAPDEAKSLLVIGHNPGLEDLATALAGSGETQHVEALRTKFPTAALAVVDFDVEGWAAIDQGFGRLERFVTPRSVADRIGR